MESTQRGAAPFTHGQPETFGEREGPKSKRRRRAQGVHKTGSRSEHPVSEPCTVVPLAKTGVRHSRVTTLRTRTPPLQRRVMGCGSGGWLVVEDKQLWR